jgi:hypothetical protein
MVMILILPLQQEQTPVSNEANGARTPRSRLSKLQEIQSKESELLLLTSRATEVLQEIATRDWEEYRAVCEAELAAAWQFWSETENLIVGITEMDVEVDESLLGQCKGLLAVCDWWVSSEEEIVELNDLSAKTYILAHNQRDLVWQKDVTFAMSPEC